jgi:hypothetical protein
MKKIAIYTTPSKFIERDLTDDFCEIIEENFNTTWITTSFLLKPHFQKKSTILLDKTSRIRYRIWLILFELEKYFYRKNKFKGNTVKPFLGLSSSTKLFLSLCIELKLSILIRKILTKILEYSVPNYKNIFEKYDCIICFSTPNDPTFDDLNRFFRKFSSKTKIIMIPINWDNSTSKPFITLPDILLTWGEQSSVLSKKLHSIPSYPLGSPRFDHYSTKILYSKREAKIKLGLDPNLNYLLFAGASFAFDEIETLNRLSNFLYESNKFNYRIIYRPHPHPWPKIEVEKNANFNFFCLYDTSLYKLNEKNFDIYNFLFTVSEALITPFSTMVLEAALHGIPTLCLGYNSILNPDFNWEYNSKFQPHLSFIEKEEWIISCYDKNILKDSFISLFKLIGDSYYSEKAVKSSSYLLYVDNLPFAKRLVNFIRNELN